MQMRGLPGPTPATTEMVPVPFDKARDQDEECPTSGCGHPYHRHFDWAGYYTDDEDDQMAVGCKYCDCYAFGGTKVPRPPKAGLIAYLLTIVEGASETRAEPNLLSSVHATHESATRSLVHYVTTQRGDDGAATPDETPEPPADPSEAVAAHFARAGSEFTILAVPIQA